MRKHSRGPWLKNGSYGLLKDEICAGSKAIATVWTRTQISRDEAEDDAEGLANLALILRAPEMSAEIDRLKAINAEMRVALAEMVNAFASGLPKAKFRASVAKARDALAKADRA